MPHSTRSSTTATPCSASQPGIGVRRPVASTIRRRAVDEAVVDADAACVGPRGRGFDEQARGPPAAQHPDLGASLDRLPQHRLERGAPGRDGDEVGSSPGCRTPAGTVAGRVARPAPARGTAASRRSSSTSGASAARMARHRARNVCEWPACGGGPPRRAARRFAERIGRHLGRCTRPRRRGRPRARGRRPPPCQRQGRHEPGHAAATTTTSASSPASRSIARRRGRRRVTPAPTRRGGRRRGGGRAGCTCPARWAASSAATSTRATAMPGPVPVAARTSPPGPTTLARPTKSSEPNVPGLVRRHPHDLVVERPGLVEQVEAPRPAVVLEPRRPGSVRLAGQADRQATISAPSSASVRAASAKPLSQQISRPRRPTGVSKAAKRVAGAVGRALGQRLVHLAVGAEHLAPAHARPRRCSARRRPPRRTRRTRRGRRPGRPGGGSRARRDRGRAAASATPCRSATYPPMAASGSTTRSSRSARAWSSSAPMRANPASTSRSNGAATAPMAITAPAPPAQPPGRGPPPDRGGTRSRPLAVGPDQRHAASRHEAAARRRGGRGDVRGVGRVAGRDQREAREAGEPVGQSDARRAGDRGHVELGAAAARLGQHGQRPDDPRHRHVLRGPHAGPHGGTGEGSRQPPEVSCRAHRSCCPTGGPAYPGRHPPPRSATTLTRVAGPTTAAGHGPVGAAQHRHRQGGRHADLRVAAENRHAVALGRRRHAADDAAGERPGRARPARRSVPTGAAPMAARSFTLTSTEHHPAHHGSRSTMVGRMASVTTTTSVPGHRGAVVADEARAARAQVAQHVADRPLGRAPGPPARRWASACATCGRPASVGRAHRLPAEAGEERLLAGLDDGVEPQRPLGLGPGARRPDQRRPGARRARRAPRRAGSRSTSPGRRSPGADPAPGGPRRRPCPRASGRPARSSRGRRRGRRRRPPRTAPWSSTNARRRSAR